MNDLKAAEAAVIELGIDASPERIAQVRDMIDFMRQECARLGKLLDGQMAEIIRERGPITLGPCRYYLGVEKSYKVRDPAALLETLLEMAGGDTGRAAGCLASGFAKHGAVRQLCEEVGLPERFDVLFEVVEKETVRDGVAVKEKKLMKMDSRFVR